MTSAAVAAPLYIPPIAPRAVSKTRVLLQHNAGQLQTQNAVVDTSCRWPTKTSSNACAASPHMAPSDRTMPCTVPCCAYCAHALYAISLDALPPHHQGPARHKQTTIGSASRLFLPHMTCPALLWHHKQTQFIPSAGAPKGHSQTLKNAQVALPWQPLIAAAFLVTASAAKRGGSC